ncbi:L-2-hydroxyglutarate oxidase [Anaerobacillus isosaccharinicus]|uniref:Hydroxyglutarate oxidase n=1 Tax=Anaerobacillus isosaccharinicus TaxID=1532552 RepID=A0A1S2L1F6_9BACI|nr:L-2-hydroxyglutarate oxidase [Anaerobacillus isosaccharinicus]MBA5588292.1 L-2-hydroxyglutarate oxidase [Anaerobacillus isosaccharinicus]QOY38271.1 L-2-hydroxyglutarate oxidase [Anaerobacillus isosaccharinicus]
MYDIVIVGGGIVGLSTGMALLEMFPKYKVTVIEKEKEVAMHQSGHNSGVIHSGIYYKPGSLKARLAKKGNCEIISFCEKHDIPYERCGKLIIATKKQELPLLSALYKRGLENGIDLHRMGLNQFKEIEPFAEGLEAIHVPSTGIVNFKQVAKAFARIIKEHGGEIMLSTEVIAVNNMHDGVELKTSEGIIKAKLVINCGGLHCDQIAQKAKISTNVKIVPFRGEYYQLKVEKRYLCKHLIYPVPNPNFPFLGVHFTRMIDGRIMIGPNAVLGLKREGYKKTDIHLRDITETLMFPGFWRVAGANWQEGLKEVVRSLSKKVLVKELQRFIPDVKKEDIMPAKAGVRAQALNRNGKLIDDFHMIHNQRMVNVLNAPSPAATASIEIGRYIAIEVSKVFKPIDIL